MSFLSPLPGSGGGPHALVSPGYLLSPGCLAATSPDRRSPHFAVREGRLSLERLLDEVSDSQESTQEEALGVFSQPEPRAAPGLAKANSAMQLDAYAGQPRAQCGEEAAMDVDPKQLEAAALIQAKLQELQELVGASGSLDLVQAEVASMSAKLQATLRHQDSSRATSSIAEALPTVVARQLRDSQQEVSMEASICAPKARHQGAQPDGQAKPASTSAASGESGPTNDGEEGAEQQATSALKPPAHLARMGSLEDPAAGPAEEEEEEQADVATDRPCKRVCYTLEIPEAPVEEPHLPASRPMPAAAAGTAARKRRTAYDKMRELESSIQEATFVGQHLQQAVARAETQHVAVMEENHQLWSAVAHLTACMHAARAAMAADARRAAALLAEEEAALLLSSPDGLSELTLSPLEDPTPAPSAVAQAAAVSVPAAAAVGAAPGLADLFGASPDALCLAEACGMLFSPAPARLPKAAPLNKPRKLFEEELAGGKAGACGAAPEAAGPLAEGVAAPVLEAQ